MKKESVNIMKKIIEKYRIKKTEKKTSFFDDCYDYKIYLKNLKTNWYIKLENKTRKCKFYSLYTRFDNKDVLKELAKTFTSLNDFSGKYNHFVYDKKEIENVINNVLFFDKVYGV